MYEELSRKLKNIDMLPGTDDGFFDNAADPLKTQFGLTYAGRMPYRVRSGDT